MAKKVPRKHIVCFRLTDSQYATLEERWNDAFPGDKPNLVKSPDKMANKLVIDALDGRLVYKNAADRSALPAVECNAENAPAAPRKQRSKPKNVKAGKKKG